MSNVETTTNGSGMTNGSSMERQPRSRVPEGETREDKFVRLAVARMSALKHKVEQVKNLAAYPHTEYQASKIINEFKALAAEVEAEFKPRGKADFSF